LSDQIDSASILTTEEVAEFLRVDPSAVIALIDSGDLCAFKVGENWRIVSQHLLEFLGRGLEVQQLASLRRALTDPRRWAHELERAPEFKRHIEANEFGEGTFGHFLQQGLETLSAESGADNIIDLSAHRRDEE